MTILSPPPRKIKVEEDYLRDDLWASSWMATDNLYASHKINPDIERRILILKKHRFSFDAYCPSCHRDSHFLHEGINREFEYGLNAYVGDIYEQSFSVVAHCTRKPIHFIVTSFAVVATELIKTGQYPSPYDLQSSDLNKFQKILGKADFDELVKSTRLYSFGVGVGAFVYLRRIFEKMVEKAAEIARDEGRLPETFATMRMDEKVSALKGILPDAVVEHRQAYRILSYGIHALNEDLCLKFFPPLQTALIRMLEAEKQKREERIQKTELDRAMGEITKEIAQVLERPDEPSDE